MKQLVLLICLIASPFVSAAEICQPQEFVDGGPTPTITIVGHGYAPRCLHVPVGAHITIQASPVHPLNGNAVAGNQFFTPNPGVGTTTTQVATQPGQFIFYCIHHGSSDGQGMAGEIVVQ